MQWFNDTTYEGILDLYLPGWRKTSEGTPQYLSQLYTRMNFQCKPCESTCIMLLFSKTIWSPNSMLNEAVYLAWALSGIEEKCSHSLSRGKLQWPSLARQSLILPCLLAATSEHQGAIWRQYPIQKTRQFPCCSPLSKRWWMTLHRRLSPSLVLC